MAAGNAHGAPGQSALLGLRQLLLPRKLLVPLVSLRLLLRLRRVVRLLPLGVALLNFSLLFI